MAIFQTSDKALNLYLCYMQLLVAAATELELNPFLNFLRDHSEAGKDNIYKIHQLKVQICITGIGCLAASYNLTKQIKQKSFDLALQAGIAGTFSDSTPLGQLFRVSKDRYADIGAENGDTYYDAAQLGWNTFNDFPYTEKGWLGDWPNTIEGLEILPSAKSITVNTVTGSRRTCSRWMEMYAPELESMEGAAFHYVCLQEAVPFAQIRSVSNRVSERDKTHWDLDGAINNLNQFLTNFVIIRTSKE